MTVWKRTDSDSTESDPCGPRSVVKATIRERIEQRQLRAGDPLPSERTLTTLLGVSRDTVRSALRELTDEGWLEAGKGSRRRVSAAQLADQGALSTCIGVLAAEDAQSFDAGKPWVEERYVLALAAAQLEQEGYHILSLSLPALRRGVPGQPHFGQLRASMIAANLGDLPVVERLVRVLGEARSPVVLYGRGERFAECSAVYSDHHAGARLLSGWLRQRGRRRIACAWIRDTTSPWMAERFAGYEAGMREGGSPAVPLIMIPPVADAHLSREGFERQVKVVAGYLAEHLRAPEPLDGLLALNDPQAIYLAAACRKLGLEPNRDVWIAGYDNTWQYSVEWAFESEGPMITVDKGNARMARQLADLTLARITGDPAAPPVRISVPPSVVVVDRAAAAEHPSGGFRPVQPPGIRS